MLLPGTKLGPYEIVACIGAGGMGEVYRARDTRLGREVAIKVLPAEFSRDSERLRRFGQEARTVASLNAPNIVSLYDIGNVNGTPYLVTEFLDGETLRIQLGHGPMPARRVVDYGVQLAHALAAAHSQGVVHRDLKPENVFITRGGHVKILDFGLAKLQAFGARASGAASDEVTSARTTDTAPGIVLGTVGYMAPEQVRGDAADSRTDIFALGALLYEMISGHRAFSRSSNVETMNAILNEEPQEFDPAVIETAPGLARIIARCLEKTPDRRFQSSSDLAFALEALSGSTTGTHRVAAPPRRRRLRIAGAAAFAALVIAILAFALLGRRAEPKYKLLVTGPGFVSSARFAPDGDHVIYGASWNGKPIELFEVTLSSIASRPLSLPPADILGISSSGEMAIALGRHPKFYWVQVGTLARAPLDGGAARALLENVCDADVSADGKDLAIVHCAGSEQTLEFPMGNLRYGTTGYVDHIRISPDGKSLAFVDHPLYGDDRGYVAILAAGGQVRRLTTEYDSINGLAWGPGAKEIWFSGNRAADTFDAIRAVTRDGRERVVLSGPADFRLQDVDAQGRALVESVRRSSGTAIHREGSVGDQVVDMINADQVLAAVSDDGATLLVTDSGTRAGTNYLTEMVAADTGIQLILGEGDACGISPDGNWALSFLPSAPSHAVLYPRGTGESRSFDLAPVRNVGMYCSWSADGNQILFTGDEPAKGTRAYILDASTGAVRAVTPESSKGILLSRDGKMVIAAAGDKYSIYPVSGGEPKALGGLAAEEFPVGWDKSGRKLFVWNGRFPANLVLLDVATGARQPWITIKPPDPAGLSSASMRITPDGKTCVYRYRRTLSTMLLAEGLR